MTQVIEVLTGSTTGISSTLIWESLGAIVPLLVIIFIFAYSVYFIGKTIRDCRP